MKKELIRIAFVFMMALSYVSSNAQEVQEKIHEVGIGFTSSTSFSLRYQWGTDRMMYRITAVSLGLTNSNSNTTEVPTAPYSTSFYLYTPTTSTPVNLSGGLNFSCARIKPINDKFGFMYGAVIGINLSYIDSKSTTDYAFAPTQQNNTMYNSNYSVYTTEAITSSYAPFIGVLAGARYQMSPSFFLYAEVTPNFSYTYATTSSTSSSGPNSTPNTDKITKTYGLSGLTNSGAAITIIYRILK